ncbi:MAG: ribonuclease P protein component 2 [Candidatus Aenigmarchaeota archaeon]|nr:ribonuclease P protein component 2 [Candidatus Aenigmarchaeota archaeon]
MEDKPKTLPASLRAKRRYIIFEVVSEKPIDYIELVGAIWRSFLDFLGELKTSELNFWLIKNLYDPKTQRGIIRCSPDQVEYVRAALSLIDQIGETRALIKVNSVTGTIKSAKKKYLGFTDLTDFEK